MEYLKIKQQIQDKLPAQQEFNDTQNLIELGLNSLQIMRLVNQWRKQGIRVSFGELMENPTLAQWIELMVTAKDNRSSQKATAIEKKTLQLNSPFPLTDVQYAYWIGRGEDQVLGNIGCHAYLEFDGAGIDSDRLSRAWNQVQHHHPMLRARFLEDGQQEIMEKPYCEDLTINDLQQLGSDQVEQALTAIRLQLSHRKLKVEHGEVAGVAISQLPNCKTRIHLDVDLLVADVQSLQLLLRDLARAYQGEALPPKSKDWSFAHYLDHQRQAEMNEREQAKQYWQGRLATLPGGPQLPLKQHPEEIEQVIFTRRMIRISQADWEQLCQKASDAKTTPAMILLTAYALVLERWSSQKRFLINIPLFNRNTEHSGLEEVIADFTTLLLLEVDCQRQSGFLALLNQIKQQLHQDMKHTAYSGVQVQRDLAQQQGGQPNAAPIVFACNLGAPLVDQNVQDSFGKFTYMISQTPQVWLDFQSYQDKDGIMLTWDTIDELFPPAMIEDMLASFEQLFLQLIQNDWDHTFELLPKRNLQQLRSSTQISPLVDPQLIHADFIRYAKTHPAAIAIVDPAAGVSLTYGELFQRAKNIAAAIIHQGIDKQPIAFTLPRGYGQIMAVLGILMSGNFYVPVSIGQPEERRKLIHQKTGITYVITDLASKSNICWPKQTVLWDLAELEQQQAVTSLPNISPMDCAYLIMTSGSTGLPKGVEIAHYSAHNTIATINQQCNVNDQDAVLCVSAMDFDLSVYDVFGLLGVGGKLVLIPDSESKNGRFWLEQVIAHQITIWNSVPVLLDMLLICVEADDIQLPFRIAMLSGDWIGLTLPDRLAAQTTACRFIALGGATEASIWSNVQEVILPLPTHWKSIPYGSALTNQVYRVVDSLGRDCPDFVAGELWIGGHGVAKGYRGDEQLTQQKFTVDQYGRWYHTGDQGRFWNDGTIEFLGRQDNQVKIRGHRIELGEIEHAMMQYAGLHQVVVMPAGEERGDQYLCAYIEPNEVTDSILLANERSYLESDYHRILTTVAVAPINKRINEQLEQFITQANKISIGIVNNTFQILGITDDDQHLGDHIRAQFGQLIERWRGILSNQKDDFANTQVTDQLSFPQLANYGQTLQRDVVRMLLGHVSPLELFYQLNPQLSPNALLSLIPGYQQNMDTIVSYVSSAAISSHQRKPLRILELGTRDANLTSHILASLKGFDIVYTYADTSLFFLDQVKQQVTSTIAVTYLRLDLEKEIGAQGFSLHHYDLVIALNSLHRSHHIDQTIKHTGDLIAAGGILIMSEFSKSTYLQEITAGLLENGFNDLADCRRDTKQLIPGGSWWQQLLLQHRFSQAAIVSEQYGRVILSAQFDCLTKVYHSEQLKTKLLQRLPEYMVPARYFFLDQLPITSNGKVDRKLLHNSRLNDKPVDNLELAITETELKLAQIWQQLFNTNQITRSDNYFTLGGDSLVATRLMATIQQQFDVKITIGTIFEKPTIKQLAAVIEQLAEQLQSDQLPRIEPDLVNQHLPFPLTDVQYAYWIGRSGIYDLGDVSTHCYFELDTAGLEIKQLQESFNRLIKRHGMMRAIVLTDGRQQILERVPEYQITVDYLTGEEQQQRLLEKREQLSHQVIDTATWPLFDIHYTVLDEKIGKIHISFDNLIFDGWSMFYILTEWAQEYREENSVTDRLTLSFRDYVLALEQVKQSDIYQTDRDYWQQRIESLSPAPELPLAKREDQLTKQRFCRRAAMLTKQEWNQIKEQAKAFQLTPSVLLISAYAEVLRRWSHNPDFTINLTQFDRKPIHPDVNQLVGDFTTLTLLEIKNDHASNFIERAKRVQQQLLSDLAHTSYSAIEVERELKKISGNLTAAIMPVVFTSGLGVESWDEGKWLGSLAYNISQTPQVWLDHQVIEKDGELCLFWDSVDELFYPGVLDQMFDAYVTLLTSLAQDQDQFTKESASLVLTKIYPARIKANQTAYQWRSETLDGLILTASYQFDERIAIVDQDRRMTYRQLREEAFYLCNQIRSQSAATKKTIAIMMEKGWEQVVSVFSILLSGNAYIPIDPSHPQERIKKILHDSGTELMIIQRKTKDQHLWLSDVHCLTVTEGLVSTTVDQVIHDASTLAYVIYTSGTTGVPKGVMISHDGAMNTIFDINQRFKVTEQDAILAISNLNFDLSVYDLFGVLGAGGKVVLPDSDHGKDPAHWIELINREQITLWNSVPAFMEMLMEYDQMKTRLNRDTLRLVMMSGDWIPVTLPEKISNCFDQVRLISLGGATEASIWSNYYEIPNQVPTHWHSIPYGQPLTNQRFYIKNSDFIDCPDWVPGTLYIGGAGLAQGYLNDPLMTAEKFVEHPDTGERLYHTGDIGRYWPDGVIEFLGRQDSQVKISGYRIELGEVEAAFREINEVKETEVLLITKDRQPLIAAFIVLIEHKPIDQEQIRQYLMAKLPEYEVPEIIITLEQIPLTANGKVDRILLTEMALNDHHQGSPKILATTLTEQSIARIWSQVLQLDCSIDDQFFKAGGDSLKAIKVINLLNTKFRYEVTLKDLYLYATIRMLASYLDDQMAKQNIEEGSL